MNMYSWFRNSLSRKKNEQEPLEIQSTQQQEDQLLGVTQQLIDFVKSFTLETFKNFPLQDEDHNDEASATPSPNGRKDLSEWQERHAVLVLSKVNELSQLRFKLCPRYLKEQRFWKIYFLLVKRYVAEFEMHATALATLKERGREKAATSNASSYEVEMAETKQSASIAPTTP